MKHKTYDWVLCRSGKTFLKQGPYFCLQDRLDREALPETAACAARRVDWDLPGRRDREDSRDRKAPVGYPGSAARRDDQGSVDHPDLQVKKKLSPMTFTQHHNVSISKIHAFLFHRKLALEKSSLCTLQVLLEAAGNKDHLDQAGDRDRLARLENEAHREPVVQAERGDPRDPVDPRDHVAQTVNGDHRDLQVCTVFVVPNFTE